MKRTRCSQYLLLACTTLLAAAGSRADTAFVNVNLLSMTEEGVQAARTVVVRDGRIAAIGPVARTEIPEGVDVVDGTDRYLLPGLAEMHGHVPGAGNEGLERVLALYLANGVTSVRGMLGQPSHLGLRASLDAGELLGPRLYTSGPSFNGNSVDSPRQAADMVAAQKAAGYDFLKVHPGLTRSEFRAMADAARDHGLRFAGHVPVDVGLDFALDAGISTIDHLDGYMQELIPPDVDPSGGFDSFFGLLLAPAADPGKIAGLVAATRAAGAWNVPTQTLFEHRVSAEPAEVIATWPEMRYVAAGTLRQWVELKRDLQDDPGYSPAVADRAIALRRQLIRELHESGAGLLLGSDAPQVFNVPGFSLHRELALLVAAGLSPYEALRTGTVNPARWFGWEDRLGTVEVGKEADLLLLDDNPLTDIGNSRRVHGVMLRGRYLDRARLDAMLAPYAR